MGVSITSVAGTLCINDNNNIEYANKATVVISTLNNFVTLQWDQVHYASYLYTDITTPSGVSASAVAASIATLVNT